MKRFFISMLLILSAFIANSQKTDLVWVVGHNMIDFNYTPPNVTYSSVDWGSNPNSILCDRDGKLLFVSSEKNLFDSNGKVIYTSKLETFGSPNLIPFPCDDTKTLYFFFDLLDGKKVLNVAILDNLTKELSFVRTIEESKIRYFRFVQQVKSNNIWFLRDNGKQIIIELITNSGFGQAKVSDKYYDLLQSSFSPDRTLLLGNSYVVEFDCTDGSFGNMINEIVLSNNRFSSTGQYIYTGVWPLAYDEGCFSILRKKLTETMIDFHFETSIKDMSDFKFGPDGILYYLDDGGISVVRNAESSKPLFETHVYKIFGSDNYFFPSTFHYEPVPCKKKGKAVWYFVDSIVEGDTIYDRRVEPDFYNCEVAEEYQQMYSFGEERIYFEDGSLFDWGTFEPGFYTFEFDFVPRSGYEDEYEPFTSSIIYDYRLYPKGSFYIKNSVYPNAILGNTVYFLGNHYLSNYFTKKPDFKYVYYTKQSDKDSTIISVGDPLPVGNYDLFVLLHDDNDCYVDKVFSQKVNITGNMNPPVLTSGSHTVCLNSSTDYYIENPVKDSKYVWNISPSAMGEIVSNSESYDKISVKWKKVGNAEISVYEVNSSGCNSDASSIEVKVLESPDAQFDNASLCYGEPLNVILSGEIPFSLEYSLDNENFSIFDINANIYQMPETAGKYSIIKVIDKNCSAIPENNNNAVIGKEMKPLKIMIGE